MNKIINKGLSLETVISISKIKKEPLWMTDFRKNAYNCFINMKMPEFGPVIDIDFNNILYFKEFNDEVTNSWNNTSSNIKKTFEDTGVIDAEKKYLDGLGAQYDSNVVYHNMLAELSSKGVIFCSMDYAVLNHSDIVKKYFNKLVKYDDNKFSALNSAVWSGGTFIYIPPYVKLDRPLQSYFRINTKNMGQFERTLIIVDHDSSLNYIEGCTATYHASDSLHAAVVEIFVEKNAKCRYTTIQNWSDDVNNLVTKRAIVSENGLMEWIDGNIGSKLNMKYPAIILKGDRSRGNCISIAVAKNNQIQDAGSKMIHLGNDTKSNIISKSIAINGGKSDYRGFVKIDKNANNCKSFINCDSIIIGDSSSYAIPVNVCDNVNSIIEHEATVSRISCEKLFYLMSRGISEEKATEMLVMGFIEAFREELPMEYAVELNKLMKNNWE